MKPIQDKEQAKTVEAFFKAIEHGRLDEARKTITEHPDAVNWEYDRGFAPLQWAIVSMLKEGMFEFALELIEKGANPNKRQPIPYGPPMLPYCLGWGKGEDIALKLVEHGADLSWKSEPGSEKQIEELAETFGNLKFIPGHGTTLLMSAAASGAVRLASVLLDKGADIHARDSRGQTALMYAAQSGRPHITELLIERGASIADQNDAGENMRKIAEEGLYQCSVGALEEAFRNVSEAAVSTMHGGIDKPLTVAKSQIKLKRNTP